MRTRRAAYIPAPMQVQQDIFFVVVFFRNHPLAAQIGSPHFFVRHISRYHKAHPLENAEEPSCAPDKLFIVAARPPLHYQSHQPGDHTGPKAGPFRQLQPHHVCALPYRASVTHRYCGTPLGNSFCKNSLSAAMGLKRSKSTSSFHCLSKSFGLSVLALANSSSDAAFSPTR